MSPVSRDDGGDRRLTRLLGVDWASPPSTLLDVSVVVVYYDGSRDLVEDDYLAIRQDGVYVEGYPLAPGKRVLQVEVDYDESIGPFSQLADFLRTLPEEARTTREEFRDWRGER